jgi:hypothetical protein
MYHQHWEHLGVRHQIGGCRLCDENSSRKMKFAARVVASCPSHLFEALYCTVFCILGRIADWIDSASIVLAVRWREGGLRGRYRQVVREVVMSDVKVASIV